MHLEFTEPPEEFAEVDHLIYAAYRESLNFAESNHRSLILFLAHELSVYFLTKGARAYFSRRYQHLHNLPFRMETINETSVEFGLRSGVNIYQNPQTTKGYVLDQAIKRTAGKLLSKHALIGRFNIMKSDLYPLLFKNGIVPVQARRKFKLDFPDLRRQEELLKELIFQLSAKVSLSNRSSKRATTDILRFVRDYVGPAFDEVVDPKWFCTVVGSPGFFHNRLLAFFSGQHEIPVVGVLHGAEAGTVDLPSWGFDDWACANYLVGYGPDGAKSFTTSLFYDYFKNVKYFPGGNNELMDGWETYPTKGLSLSSDTINRGKGLYIEQRTPKNFTLLSAKGFYDPISYAFWKKSLLAKLPNINLKLHPKGDYPNFELKKDRIETRPLTEAINDYDFLIVDFAGSTAFAVAASSAKPIILIDRPPTVLTHHARRLVENRCLVLKASGKSFDEILSDLAALEGSTKSFEYTASLCSQPFNQSRLSAFTNIFEDISHRKLCTQPFANKHPQV